MKIKVATNKQELSKADKFDGCPVVDTLDKATSVLKNAGFEGCTVWVYNAKTKHWGIVFDTSLPDSCRLPGATYWGNVVTHLSQK